MCRRLENSVNRTAAWPEKESLQADYFIDKACESASRTSVILKILQHTDEDFTRTVAVNDVSSRQMRAPRYQTTLKIATFVLVLFLQQPAEKDL